MYKVYTFYIPKITDVVRAYRGIIKEKEALEASLKALSQVGETEEREKTGGEGEGVEKSPEGERVEREGEKEGEGEEGGTLSSETEESEKDTSISAEKKVMKCSCTYSFINLFKEGSATYMYITSCTVESCCSTTT